MNFELTRELLTAASEQPHTPLQIKGRAAAREVELLAEAGFVIATADPLARRPTAVIERVTESGKKLLRVLSSSGGSWRP